MFTCYADYMHISNIVLVLNLFVFQFRIYCDTVIAFLLDQLITYSILINQVAAALGALVDTSADNKGNSAFVAFINITNGCCDPFVMKTKVNAIA